MLFCKFLCLFYLMSLSNCYTISKRVATHDQKNTTPFFIKYLTVTEHEHAVKSRNSQETLMSNAPSVIGCQIKHELKVIKNKMDDLDKSISCTVKCATHGLFKQTAKEMRELACKIEDLGKSMECKPPVSKPCNSKDHKKGDVKKKNNIEVIHEYREIPYQEKVGERSFMQNDFKDFATISKENNNKNKNDVTTSTVPTFKVKDSTISDKLLTFTNLKVPSTTVSSATISTQSSTTDPKNKLSKHTSQKATKKWHFTLPFTKEDFSMLRVLEDLLKNQPKTTTEISFPNVIGKPDTKQSWNHHKRMSEYANKRDAGYEKGVRQSEDNDIPASSTIQTKIQDANSLLDLQDQGISANGVESWYRKHFLISHGRHHSKRKFHTKQTVTLRTNDKKSSHEMREKNHDIRCTNNKENKDLMKSFTFADDIKKINKVLKCQTDKRDVDFKKRVTRSKRNNDAQDNANTMLIRKTEQEKSTVENGEVIVDVAALRNEQQNAKNTGYVSYKVVPINTKKTKKKKKGWCSRFFRKHYKQKRQYEDKLSPLKKLRKMFKFSKSPRYYINDYIYPKPSNENEITTTRTSYTTNKYGENKFDSVLNQFAQEWKSLKNNNAEKLTASNLEKSEDNSTIQTKNKSSTVYTGTKSKTEVKHTSSPKQQYQSEEKSKLYKNEEENLLNTKARYNDNQLKNSDHFHPSDLKLKDTNLSNYSWSYAADFAKSLTNKMPVLKWDSNEEFTAKPAQKDKKPNIDYNNDIENVYNDLKKADEILHKKLRSYRQLLDRNNNQLCKKRGDRNYYRNKQKRYLHLFKKKTESSNLDNDSTKAIADEDIGVTVIDIDDNYGSKHDTTSKLYIDDETHQNSITEKIPYEYTLTIYWSDQEATQTNKLKTPKHVSRKKKKRKKKVKTTLETTIKDETANPSLTEEYPANSIIEKEQVNDNTVQKESNPMQVATTLIKASRKETDNEKAIIDSDGEIKGQIMKEVVETTSEKESNPLTFILTKVPIESEKANDVAISDHDLENKEQQHGIVTTLATELSSITKTTTLIKLHTERDHNEKFEDVATPEQALKNKEQNPETNTDTSHLVIVMPKVKKKENPKRVVLSSHTSKYEIYYDDIIEKTSATPEQGSTARKTSIAAEEDQKGRSRHRNRRRMTVRRRKKRKSNRHRKRRGMTVLQPTHSDRKSLITFKSLAINSRRQRDVSLAPKYQGKPRQSLLTDLIGADEIFSQTWVKNEDREESSTDEEGANTEESYHSNEVTKTETTEGSKPLLVTTALVAKKEETIANVKPKTEITKLSQVAADTAIKLESNDKPSNKHPSGKIIVFPEADVNVEEENIRQLLLKLSQKSHKPGVQDKEGVTFAEDDQGDLLSQTQRRILAANERLEESVSLLQNAFKNLDTFSSPLNYGDHYFTTRHDAEIITSKITEDLTTVTVANIPEKSTQWKEKLLRMLEHFSNNRVQPNSHKEVTADLNFDRIPVSVNNDDDLEHNYYTTQCNTDTAPSKTTEDQTTLANTEEKFTPWKEKLLRMLENFSNNRVQPNLHKEATDEPNVEQKNKYDDPEHNYTTQCNTDTTPSTTEEQTTLANTEEKYTQWKEKLQRMLEKFSNNHGQPNSNNVVTDEPVIKKIPVSTAKYKDDNDSEHSFTTKMNTDLMKNEIAEVKTTPAKTEGKFRKKGKLLQIIKNFSVSLGSNSHNNEAIDEAKIKQMAIKTKNNKDDNSEIKNKNQSTRNWFNYFTSLEKLIRKSTKQSSESIKETLYDRPTTAYVSENINKSTERNKAQPTTFPENEVAVETKTESQLLSDTASEASSQSHDSNVGEIENSENQDQNTAVEPDYNKPHKTTETHHPNKPLTNEPNFSSQITKAINRITSNSKKKQNQTSTVTEASKTEPTFLNDLTEESQEENKQSTPITTETTTRQTKGFDETLSESGISPEIEQQKAANKYSDASEENEKVDVKSENAATDTSNTIEPEKESSAEAQLTTVRQNEAHKTAVIYPKNSPVTEVPDILLNTKHKLENQQGHGISNTIIINFGPNMSDTLKTMLSEKSLTLIPEIVTSSQTTPSIKSFMKVSETITPSQIYTAKEPYLISILPPKLKDLIWIPETTTAPELQRTINKREASSIYTAKDVDSLDILLDYIDTVGAKDSETRTKNLHSVVKLNSELFPKKDLDEDNNYKEKSNKRKTHAEKLEHNRNSIQVHITIPNEKSEKRVARSTYTSKIRKIFSATMLTPVDIEYQLHPYTVYDMQPVTNNIVSFTRDYIQYSITPNDAKSKNINTNTKSDSKDNMKRLSRTNFEASTLTTNDVSKCERRGMKKDYIKSIDEDLMRFFNKLTKGRDKTIAHRRNKRSLEHNSRKGHQNFKRELKVKEEETNTTKKDQKCRRRINWNWYKNYFNKNSRTCTCKFIPYKPMSKACAASDAVMTELIAEFEKMGQFMSDHCTEIQTFFWMNPSGGKKLRELVNKINKNLDAYYRRTKGICKGQPCSSFKKKRDLERRRLDDSNGIKRYLITTKCEKQNFDNILADLRNLAVDLRYAKKYVLCGDSKSLSQSQNAVNNLIKETDKILSHNRTRRLLTSDLKRKKHHNFDKTGVNTQQRTASFKMSKAIQKSMRSVLRPNFDLKEYDEDGIPHKIKKGIIKSQTKNAKSKNKIRKRDNGRVESPLQAENNGLSWQFNLNTIVADSKNSPRTDSLYSSDDTELSKIFSATEENSHLKLELRYLLDKLATTPTAILTTNPKEIHKEKPIGHYTSDFKKPNSKCNKACNFSKIDYHPPNQRKCSVKNCYCPLGRCNCSKTTCPCPPNKCTCAKHSELQSKAAKIVILDIGAETDLNNEVKKKLDKSKENSNRVLEERKCSSNVNVEKNAQVTANTGENVEKDSYVKPETYDRKHVESKALSDETLQTNAEIKSEKNLKISADINSKSDVKAQENTQQDQDSELEKAIADFLTHIDKNIQEEDKINQQKVTQKSTVPNKFVNQFKSLFQHQNTHKRLRKDVKHFITKAGEKVIHTIDSITNAGNKVIHKLEEGIEEAKKLMPNASTTSTVPNASYVCDLMATREYIRHKYNMLQSRTFKRFIQGINCRRHKKLPPHFFVRLRDFIIDEPSEIRRERPGRSRKFRSFEVPPKKRRDRMSRKRSLLSIDHNNNERDGNDDTNEKDGDYDSLEGDDNYNAKERHAGNGNHGTDEKGDDNDSYERNDDYGTHQKYGNYNANKRDSEYDSYEGNGDYGTHETDVDYDSYKRDGDYGKAYEIYGNYDTYERDGHYDTYEKDDDYNSDKRDGSEYTPYEKESDYGTYERVDDKYSSNRKSPTRFVYDHQKTRRYKTKKHARKLIKSRINKNIEGLFEKLYRGEDNVYREERRRQKRAQASLKEFILGLENLPVVATDQDDLYVMKGEDVKINCIPRQTIDLNIKFRKSAWETSRPEMKHEANYKENELYITLTEVHSRNVGNYICKLDGQVVREVRLSLITMPRFHVVFTALYKTDGDCTYKDLKNIRYLGPVFSEASACGDKSVQIHEPVCLKLADTGFLGLEDQSTSSFIRATCSLSVCPEPVVQCGVNCVRDIHAKLVKLGAGNVTPLPGIPVTIQRNGVNRTLTPVIHKYKMVVTHKLRQDKPKLREELEFHQLSLSMGPGDRDTVVSCRAGYWLMKEFMICAACPANMYSNRGDNKCLPCPQDMHSQPGSSHCVPSERIVRDSPDHSTPKNGLQSLWQYLDVATYWQSFRKKCTDPLIISNFTRNFYILIPAILVCIIISKYRCCKKKKKGNRGEIDLEEVGEAEIEEKGKIGDKVMRSIKSRAKLEKKENLLQKFLMKPKTQGSQDEFQVKSETQGIQVDPFPVKSETQGIQVDPFPVKSETQGIQVDPFPVKSETQGIQVDVDSVERVFKGNGSMDQEKAEKYMKRRSCVCGRNTCTCNSTNRTARGVCAQEHEKDGSTSKSTMGKKSCRCKMPTCVCSKKNSNKNNNSTVSRIWSYSSPGVGRKNKLSASAVILARFFRPSTSSSLADELHLQDSTSSRFEQWKEKNIPPPLPPIDFDSDSTT